MYLLAEKLKTERTQIEKNQMELRRNIKKAFKGSTPELKQELRDFADRVQEKERTLKQNEVSSEKLSRKIINISEEKTVLLKEQGMLQQEAERHKNNIKQRDALIETLADRYSVTGYVTPVSDRKVAQFLAVLEDREREMEEELRAKRVTFDQDEATVQEEIDELRNTKTKLETELSMKLETLDKNRKEIREIKQQLNHVEASAEKLNDINRDLKKVDRELTEAEKAVDLNALKGEVRELQKSKQSQDAKMKTLDTELNRLSLDSTARTQLDVFRKDKTAKLDTVRKHKSKIEDSMKHLLGHMPTENLRRELDKCSSKLSRSVRATNDQVQKLKHEKTQRDTQLKMQREQLTSKMEELRGYEERLNNVSGSQNFDEGLEKLQVDLRKSQAEQGQLKGFDYIYRKYLGTLDDEDAPCPLCRRPFDSRTEVDELIDDISSKLNVVPEKIEKAETKINRTKTRVEEMIQLRPIRSAMADLEGDDIPKLKQKIKVLGEQVEKLSLDITDKEDELETATIDESAAQSIQTDVAMIDKIQNELKDLDRKIAQQASKLSGGDSGRSMQDVQAEREEIQMDLETVNRNLDRKRQKISEQSDHVQQLKTTLNELRAEKLQIESDLQQQTRLEENKVALESANDTLSREVKDSKQEMRPLQDSISDKERHKQKISKEKETQYERGMGEISGVKDEHRKVKTYNSEVENYMKKGRDRQLKQNTEAMEAIEAKASTLILEKDEISAEIDEIKEDLAMQKMRERELSDNLAIRTKQEEVDSLGQQIEDHEQDLGGLDVNNLNHEVKDMERKMERLSTEKHQAQGRQGGLEDQIRRLKKELRMDLYKDAEAQYREKMIALRTTELANQDLDKYYKALDRTIMSYHSLKMSEINKIIRELWRNTYKGNDIETIEIRSDEEEGSGASKTRRSYNYRVVMIKGDTALDMRNRCSAGQKVLASLIIRLALAETFCLNCGILALDEPTTNLDRENIESLAYALVEIIKSRSRQRNFQLIIITHDEDFVELLGRSDYVDEFFKVRKNEYGCSQLVKAKVQDLHTR